MKGRKEMMQGSSCSPLQHLSSPLIQ